MDNLKKVHYKTQEQKAHNDRFDYVPEYPSKVLFSVRGVKTKEVKGYIPDDDDQK